MESQPPFSKYLFSSVLQSAPIFSHRTLEYGPHNPGQPPLLFQLRSLELECHSPELECHSPELGYHIREPGLPLLLSGY